MVFRASLLILLLVQISSYAGSLRTLQADLVRNSSGATLNLASPAVNGDLLTYSSAINSWVSVTHVGGTGTVTNITSGDGSLDITNSTTTPDLRIHWPLTAGVAGIASAPAITWGGSGIYQSSFGLLNFATSGVERLRLENNGDVIIAPGGTGSLTVNGPGVFTGNISAANYPPPSPTGNALSFAGYDNTGSLFSIPGWNFQDGSGAPAAYISRDITADGGFTSFNYETAAEQTADTNIGVTGLFVNTHFDRNNTGFNGGSLYGLSAFTTQEGSGILNEVRGFNSYAQAGNGNGGSVNYLQAGAFQANVEASAAVNNDLNGLFVGLNAASTSVGGGGYLYNGNLDRATYTNNFNAIVLSTGNSIFNNTFNLYNGYTPNSNVFNGEWDGVNIGNDAQINGFTYGVRLGLNGNMVQNITGVGVSTNANSLASPGYNMTVFDGNINNTLFLGDNFNFVNGFIAGVASNAITNVNGFGFNSQISGAYRFTGLNINNNQDFTEEIKMGNFNSQGNARAIHGVNISLTGNATDEAVGLDVNVNNTTSTNQRPVSASFQGGTFQVQGSYTPRSGQTFEIGNNITATSTVETGSPLTGSDQIIQLIQANLLANDSISTGPVGLDTNMIGMVSQIVASSGVTMPLSRALIVGTSVPGGSGGTLTEHQAISIIGLPSFGGSLTNITRKGVSFEGLFGQSFCGGGNPATTCWGIYMPDASGLNWLAGGLVTGGSTGLPSGAYELEINGDSNFIGVAYASSGVQLRTSNTQPTCDSAHRGLMWNLEGGSGVPDLFQICQKDITDSYVWVNH